MCALENRLKKPDDYDLKIVVKCSHRLMEANCQIPDSFLNGKVSRSDTTGTADSQTIVMCNKLIQLWNQEMGKDVMKILSSETLPPNFQNKALQEVALNENNERKVNLEYIKLLKVSEDSRSDNKKLNPEIQSENLKVQPHTFSHHKKIISLPPENHEIVVRLTEQLSGQDQCSAVNLKFGDPSVAHLQKWSAVGQPRETQEAESLEKAGALQHANEVAVRNGVPTSKSVMSLSTTFSLKDDKSSLLLDKIRIQEEIIGKLNYALLSLSKQLQEEVAEKENASHQLFALNQKILSMQQDQAQISLQYAKDLRVQNESNSHALESMKNSLEEAQKRTMFLLSAYHNLSSTSFSSRKLVLVEEQESRFDIEKAYLQGSNATWLSAIHELRSILAEENRISSQNRLSAIRLQRSVSNAVSAAEELRKDYEEKSSVAEDQAKIIFSLQERLKNTLLKEENSVKIILELEETNALLKGQVASLTKELDKVDEVVIPQITKNSCTVNHALKENRKISAELEEVLVKYKLVSDELSVLKRDYTLSECQCATFCKTLESQKLELLAANKNRLLADKKVAELGQQVIEKESEFNLLAASNSAAENCIVKLREELEKATVTFNSVLESRKDEFESLQKHFSHQEAIIKNHEKANLEHIRAIENYELSIATLKKSLEVLEEKNTMNKKILQGVCEERDKFQEDHDIIALKLSCLQQENAKQQKLASVIVADLQKLVSLSSVQERNLEKLRQENVLLKESLGMLISAGKPTAESVYTVELNLAEGPLRYPRKRVKSSL